MKNIMKKILTFLILAVFTVTVVGCKDDDYKYPNKTPMISNATDSFVKVGDYTVTNEKAYVNLITNYGYTALIDWMDNIVLPTDTTGFENYLNKQIYGTDDLDSLTTKEKTKAKDSWETSMKNKGYQTEEEWTAAYKLEYRRQEYAKSQIESEITEFEKLVTVLEGIDFNAYETSDLTLKLTDESVDKDLKITWASDSSYVVVKKNKTTAKVTQGKYDVEVTLTATATLNDYSTTATYKFTVPALSSTVTSAEKAEKEVTGYFSDANYENILNSEYAPEVKAAVVTFDSDAEARALLKKYGIDLNKLKGQKWSYTTGEELTLDQVKEVFVGLTNDTKGTSYTTIDEVAETKSYDDWADFNSTITTKLYALTALNRLNDGTEETENKTYHNSYTLLPTAFGNRFYLAIVLEKGDDTALETVKAEIKKELIENKITSNLIKRYAFEKTLKDGKLHIYDEGLENTFVSSYNSVYSNLSISEYDEYTRTKGTSSENVASLEYNGQTYSLTADEMFKTILKTKGNDLAITYLDNYTVLAHSKIVNVATGEVLDKEKYDKIYKADVKAVKSDFKDNEFKSDGYPKSYGWMNYLRDYYGITSELDLILDTDGDIYSEALENYQETLWTDELVTKQAKRIFDEYFRTTVYSVSTWFDKDDNGSADAFGFKELESDDNYAFYEMAIDDFVKEYGEKYEKYGVTEATIRDAKTTLNSNIAVAQKFAEFLKDLVDLSYADDKDAKAAEMVTKYYSATSSVKDSIIAIANAIAEDNEATSDRYSAISTNYAIVTPNDSVFGQFKKQGLQFTVSSSTTYTQTSSIDDYYKDKLRTIYNEIINYQASYTSSKDEKDEVVVNEYGTDIMGKNLDPYYEYTKDGNRYVVKPFTTDAFYNKNQVTIAYVTQATDRTKISKEVKNVLDENGNEVLDENGANKKEVSYSALDFAIKMNYDKYLLDSDDDDDTSSGLTSTQKSVVSTYYVGGISAITDEYQTNVTEEVIKLFTDNKVTLNANLSKDVILATLNDSLE